MSGVRAAGTKGASVQCLAIYSLSPMLFHRVVTNQVNEFFLAKVHHQKTSQSRCRLPSRPASLREDSVVTAPVPMSQRTKCAQEVGYGASPCCEDDSQGEQKGALVGRLGEDRPKCDEQRHRFGGDNPHWCLPVGLSWFAFLLSMIPPRRRHFLSYYSPWLIPKSAKVELRRLTKLCRQDAGAT